MACIEARGLRKSFGTTVALDGINFRVEEGRILGMIGPNGAGKTTALNAILGLTPYQGELRVLGRNPWTERDQLTRDVCFIADVAVLPRWIRVSQALDYVAGVHPRFDRAKAEAFLAKTTIARDRKVKQLSKGMVAQLHLALVMAIDAKLLVLDEPTLGLDLLYRKQFYDSLLNDYFDRNRTIVVTTHQVEELQHVLTDLMFMDRGRIVLDTSMEDVESRYAELAVLPAQLAAARALKPISERDVLGRSILLFDLVASHVDRQQLAALGEVRTPGIADLFVAVLERSERSRCMNTPNIAMTEASAPRTISFTQSFYWSVRREFWENRLIYLAPLAAAVIFLVSFVINTMVLRHRMAGIWLVHESRQQSPLDLPYGLCAALIMGIALVVGIFYSLDALYGERRDRSILFWKSMPVSDLTTVLSKLSIPLVIIPVLSYAITLVTQFIMLVLASAVLLGSGANIALMWTHESFFRVLTRPLLPHAHRSWALVCASLRLAAAGFCCGAARSICMGRYAALCDLGRGKDGLQYHAFSFFAKGTPDGATDSGDGHAQERGFHEHAYSAPFL